MFPRPSLESHTVLVSRTVSGVDAEGTPLSTYVDITSFKGGFGELSVTAQPILGFDGQRVEAAVSTFASPDIQLGDKATVAGRDWRVVGIRNPGPTTRVLLAAWGAK